MQENSRVTRQGDQFIISIHPEWVKKILDGQKLYEVRRTGPHLLTGGATVWIYETANGGGGGLVVAKFHCPHISRHAMGWNKPGLVRMSCLSEDELFEYQGTRRNLCFWEIEDAEELKVPLFIFYFGLRRPPQSWCRVPRGYEL